MRRIAISLALFFCTISSTFSEPVETFPNFVWDTPLVGTEAYTPNEKPVTLRAVLAYPLQTSTRLDGSVVSGYISGLYIDGNVVSFAVESTINAKPVLETTFSFTYYKTPGALIFDQISMKAFSTGDSEIVDEYDGGLHDLDQGYIDDIGQFITMYLKLFKAPPGIFGQ